MGRTVMAPMAHDNRPKVLEKTLTKICHAILVFFFFKEDTYQIIIIIKLSSSWFFNLKSTGGKTVGWRNLISPRLAADYILSQS